MAYSSKNQVKIASVNDVWQVVKYKTIDGYEKKLKTTEKQYPVTIDIKNIIQGEDSFSFTEIQLYKRECNAVYLNSSSEDENSIDSDEEQKNILNSNIQSKDQSNCFKKLFICCFLIGCRPICIVLGGLISFLLFLTTYAYFFATPPQLLALPIGEN